MTELVFVPISVIGAYLLGSISFGIIMSQLFGLPDPRTVGSGNPGATNVLRSGKKAAAALTLIGDTGKGWVAVWLAFHYSLAPWLICLIALAVFLGHLYPIFYKFKGGKGVATALGILLALSPWVGLSALLTWIITFAIWRYSSLAALVAAGLAPIYVIIFLDYKGFMVTSVLISLLLFWRHRGNIQKLTQGNEAGFGKTIR
ncbi:MAG TPA: glycerol-3-phosphate 1-O-acyltransferase PlsY [Methylophilaceae bacterium]|nr:glycerol-3-phosphate 1-O-acyltransferase PlsY [Methylophilaceae bacterium]